VLAEAAAAEAEKRDAKAARVHAAKHSAAPEVQGDDEGDGRGSGRGSSGISRQRADKLRREREAREARNETWTTSNDWFKWAGGRSTAKRSKRRRGTKRAKKWLLTRKRRSSRRR